MAFTFEGVEYRVADGVVQKREAGGRRWQPCSKASLLLFDVDSSLWDWLRSQGVKRPSPAGGEDGRTTTSVLLRLEPRDANRLTEISEAEGTTKSGLVTRWIREHK